MTALDDILQVARSQVGYTEGKNNDTPYGRWYGMNHEPWCAIFISWCADQADIPTTVIPKHAYTPSGANWFRARGRWHTNSPRAGDIIYFNIGLGRISHVGIIEKVHGSTVTTIEGNTDVRGGRTGGQVMRKTRPARGGVTVGYGRPAYEDARPTAEMRMVQTRLALLGMLPSTPSTVDGIRGPVTEGAVRAFQTKAKIEIDGVVGPQTLKALTTWPLNLPTDNPVEHGARITPGTVLRPGDTTTSGSLRITMQTDGNLVAYWQGRPVWSTETRGSWFQLQTDGNGVLYLEGAGHRCPVWSTRTNGKNTAYMVAQGDGNWVAYNHHGKPVWNTGIPQT